MSANNARLYESLGDTMAFGNVREIIALLKDITEACQRRVVKTIGDGLMCAFPLADHAASAAGEMHKKVAALPPLQSGKQLTIRVRVHYVSGS